MITAVDTSVVLDLFLPDDRFGPSSLERLRNAYDQGAILICDVVYSELVPAFPDRYTLDGALGAIGAHALASADTFLTRDSGFYATYFPELTKTVG